MGGHVILTLKLLPSSVPGSAITHAFAAAYSTYSGGGGRFCGRAILAEECTNEGWECQGRGAVIARDCRSPARDFLLALG
jgi:hypothetical protein